METKAMRLTAANRETITRQYPHCQIVKAKDSNGLRRYLLVEKITVERNGLTGYPARSWCAFPIHAVEGDDVWLNPPCVKNTRHAAIQGAID